MWGTGTQVYLNTRESTPANTNTNAKNIRSTTKDLIYAHTSRNVSTHLLNIWIWGK